MTAPTNTTAPLGRLAGQTGDRVELARYTITAGTRVLLGQRVNGNVRVSDHPADGRGRAVLIERGLEQDGNAALWALVNDYLQQATLYDQVPMLASPVDRYLQHLGVEEMQYDSAPRVGREQS
jgi:hypothetical protein